MRVLLNVDRNVNPSNDIVRRVMFEKALADDGYSFEKVIRDGKVYFDVPLSAYAYEDLIKLFEAHK